MHTARLSCGVLLGLSRLTQLRSASDVCMMDRAIRLYEGSSRVKRADYIYMGIEDRRPGGSWVVGVGVWNARRCHSRFILL